jgi:hypothetical protein
MLRRTEQSSRSFHCRRKRTKYPAYAPAFSSLSMSSQDQLIIQQVLGSPPNRGCIILNFRLCARASSRRARSMPSQTIACLIVISSYAQAPQRRGSALIYEVTDWQRRCNWPTAQSSVASYQTRRHASKESEIAQRSRRAPRASKLTAWRWQDATSRGFCTTRQGPRAFRRCDAVKLAVLTKTASEESGRRDALQPCVDGASASRRSRTCLCGRLEAAPRQRE